MSDFLVLKSKDPGNRIYPAEAVWSRAFSVILLIEMTDSVKNDGLITFPGLSVYLSTMFRVSPHWCLAAVIETISCLHLDCITLHER